MNLLLWGVSISVLLPQEGRGSEPCGVRLL